LVTIRQVKAARALLGWSQSDLADRSGVSEPTIARLESGEGVLGGRGETTRKICEALEAGGVYFIEENGGGLGVRLRNKRPKKFAK
jgi:transcriptional regulator with XRE-family HTH domain